LEEVFERMTKDELDALYRLCFGKKGPGMSRWVEVLKPDSCFSWKFPLCWDVLPLGVNGD